MSYQSELCRAASYRLVQEAEVFNDASRMLKDPGLRLFFHTLSRSAELLRMRADNEDEREAAGMAGLAAVSVIRAGL